MRFDLTTRASPDQVFRAFTDFSDRRLDVWHKTLDAKVYELVEVGDGWAVAREGSPRSPYWVLLRYEWTDPGEVRWTELETNHGEGGAGSVRITPTGDGGSRLDVHWYTHPVRVRDKVALWLLHHLMNRPIARMWTSQLDRIANAAR